MSGAFLLIRYFPGVENIFVNHRHLVWFHSDDEGLRLIEYYLTNSDEREQIARQGHTYLSEHTGWRRKNIIVDYPLALSHGEKRGFGAPFRRLLQAD
jgi:spore maturation protein CgeB